MRTSLILFALVATTACKPEPGKVPTVPGSGQPVVGLPSGVPTGVPTGTTESTPTSLPEFDCAAIPGVPVSATDLGAPRGYHDLAFTTDGKIIGSDNGFVNNDLLRVDDTDTVEILVDNLGLVQQMAWLPDGDLAAATDNTGAIVRIDAAGAVSVISPNVNAYGLILGPDDMLWACQNQNQVVRIDPTTGAKETVIASIPSGGPRVINFNRDFTRLYIGTLGGNGSVYYVELDANYDPVGGPQVLASNVGSGAYHDGLGVDVCGYLYIPDYSTSALYRVNPTTGQVQNLYDTQIGGYGHGLEWGNGVGPWRTDAIYLPRPYGNHQVTELVIGVPTVWDGIVVNAP